MSLAFDVGLHRFGARFEPVTDRVKLGAAVDEGRDRTAQTRGDLAAAAIEGQERVTRGLILLRRAVKTCVFSEIGGDFGDAQKCLAGRVRAVSCLKESTGISKSSPF